MAAFVIMLAASCAASADPPERIPVVMVEQTGAPVRVTEMRPEVSLIPVNGTLTTVWFVRGLMTNVTSKRIIAVEMMWVLLDARNEPGGTVANRYELVLEPGERHQMVVGVITDLLYKPGVRVQGMVRRVQFVDGSIWTPPPANMTRRRITSPRAPSS